MNIKVITLTQPWATLVAIGAKQFETRSWQTSYRGKLAIHAAKGWKREDIELCLEEPFKSALIKAGVSKIGDLPRGAIIAVCDLTAIYPTDSKMPPAEPERSFGDYSSGRFAWQLENVQRLTKIIPARGHLSLWDFDMERL